MAVGKYASRFTVSFNPILPLERVILDRLQPMTTPTRQQWLRSLLIEGFLLECRTLPMGHTPLPASVSAPTFARRPAPPPAPYVFPSTPRSTGNQKQAMFAVDTQADANASRPSLDKPLAHLRRVIG